MTEHVDALEGERRKLEKERKELMQSLGGLQARVDDAFNEQVSPFFRSCTQSKASGSKTLRMADSLEPS